MSAYIRRVSIAGSPITLLEASFGSRVLIASPSVDDAIFKELKAKWSETFSVTGYLVPDEDFGFIKSERFSLLSSNFNYMPISMPPLYYVPLDYRLAGQSVSDFLTLFRLEQYDGLVGYGQRFSIIIERFLGTILPEDSEEYELEWRLKDVLHAFSSPLLKTVLTEIRAAYKEESDPDHLLKGNELIKIEKKIIKLKFELESFLNHQRDALTHLVQSLENVKPKASLLDLRCQALCTEALYHEILGHPKESWTKLSLITYFIESQDGEHSWTTFPEKRNFLAPFFLKCAFESVKNKFPKEKIVKAILLFDEIALDLSLSHLQNTPAMKDMPSDVVESIQHAFFEMILPFSKPPKEPLEKIEHAVYDQSLLSLLPPMMKDRGPLIMIDPENKSHLSLTKAGEEVLKCHY